MNKIRGNLYLGNARDARYRPRLKDTNISVILNVAYEVNDPIYDHIRCIKVGLSDSTENKVYLRELAITTLIQVLQAKEKVLVHCNVGMSRSVFVASFALSAMEKKDAGEIFREIRNSRPFAIQSALWSHFAYPPKNYKKW